MSNQELFTSLLVHISNFFSQEGASDVEEAWFRLRDQKYALEMQDISNSYAVSYKSFGCLPFFLRAKCIITRKKLLLWDALVLTGHCKMFRPACVPKFAESNKYYKQIFLELSFQPVYCVCNGFFFYGYATSECSFSFHTVCWENVRCPTRVVCFLLKATKSVFLNLSSMKTLCRNFYRNWCALRSTIFTQTLSIS